MVCQSVLIHTGNIIPMNEPKTKAKQNPTDELVETLKIVLRDNQSSGDGPVLISGKEGNGLEGVDRKDIKITVKVFMSMPKVELLKEAVDEVCKALHTDTIESLVIAYSSKESPEDLLRSLTCLWAGVEEYVKSGKLSSIGLSDVSTNVFIELFNYANIKPNIMQISLTTCCVVPPALQTFTKENDVQLLTHSDPGQILPQEKLHEVFGTSVSLHWVTRYQIHLKCRGILSSKGYLVHINKEAPTP